MRSVRVYEWHELNAGWLSVWSEIQKSEPALDSPYFRPEFTSAVAAVRDDVRVGVVFDGPTPQAFFPFQIGTIGTARPVGGRLSDYHGLIAPSGFPVSARELLRGCGLRSWQFDHLPASQRSLARHAGETEPSHFIDLADGYEAYAEEKRAAGLSEYKDNAAKKRKLEREHGSFAVEFDERGTDALRQLKQWKSSQYERTNLTDVFGFDWTGRLLERIHAESAADFGGTLSTLRCGGRLIAAHFCLRTSTVLHSWFPGYDVEFGKYSPGVILLLEMARLAGERGVRKIDFGKGRERYKVALSSGSTPLAEGRVYRTALACQAAGSLRSVKNWLKTGPLSAPVDFSARKLRPLRQRRSFA